MVKVSFVMFLLIETMFSFTYLFLKFLKTTKQKKKYISTRFKME